MHLGFELCGGEWVADQHMLHICAHKKIIDLEYLGVDPNHQRRGVGRMLLDWGTKRADAREKDCYLFGTAAGRPLYEAAGFTIAKDVTIFGAPHYAMLRRRIS